MHSRSKTKCQYIHFKNRLKERFNINLTKDMHKRFVKQIQTGKADFIERKSNRLTIWAINYENQTLVFVYDKERKSIATVLPKDCYMIDEEDNKVLFKYDLNARFGIFQESVVYEAN